MGLSKHLNEKKILAIASGGGHWIQLLRLGSAFDGYETVYVGVDEMYRSEVPFHKFYVIRNVSRLHKITLPLTILKIFYIIIREKPSIIVTTGSAPGLIALRVGKMLRVKTIWIDSVANVEEMSFSGMKARNYADLWLTQWEHLAKPEGPKYLGTLL